MNQTQLVAAGPLLMRGGDKAEVWLWAPAVFPLRLSHLKLVMVGSKEVVTAPCPALRK